MRLVPVHHRPPRAGVDPINDVESAFLVISTALTRPLRHETVVLLLDDERRGIAVVIVSGTVDPDAVVAVVELVTHPSAHRGRIGAVVVGSVRPGGGSDESDVDRWLEMSDLADQSGVELAEWFVIGDAVTFPRDDLGEPPRW